MLEIEKGIPIPKVDKSYAYDSKYPFKVMEVGDSFFVPVDREQPRKQFHRVAMNISASCRAKRMNGKKFLTRTLRDGVRCWRVE